VFKGRDFCKVMVSVSTWRVWKN